MGRIYNNTGKIQVRGYGYSGYVPYQYTRGGNVGKIMLESTKQIAKHGIPIVKKAWASLSPDAREAVIQGGIDVGMQAASRIGQAANLQMARLGTAAKGKLEQVLGKSENTSRISAEAEKMMKKLVKSGKKKALAEAKKKMKNMKPANKLPASVQKNLSKAQKKKLNEDSLNMISKMLSGQGLKLLK